MQKGEGGRAMETKEEGGVNPDLAPLHLRLRAGWAAIQQGVKGKGAAGGPPPLVTLST
jgi:hypothetical protein